MADPTQDLASTLGLSTRQQVDRTMPFTRAAQTELQYDLAAKRAEMQAQKAQEALKKQLLTKIKIPASKINKNFIEETKNDVADFWASPALAAGDYYEASRLHDELMQRNKTRELKSEFQNKQAEIARNPKILLTPEVRKAAESLDLKAIEKLSQQYPDEIQYDPQERVFTVEQTPDINLADYFTNKMTKLKSGEFERQINSGQKIGAKRFEDVAVPDNILRAEAIDIAQEPTLYRNVLKKNRILVNQLVNGGMTEEMAVQTAIYNNLKTQAGKTIDVTQYGKKEVSNNFKQLLSGGGAFELNGFTYNPIGEYHRVGTKATGTADIVFQGTEIMPDGTEQPNKERQLYQPKIKPYAEGLWLVEGTIGGKPKTMIVTEDNMIAALSWPQATPNMKPSSKALPKRSGKTLPRKPKPTG